MLSAHQVAVQLAGPKQTLGSIEATMCYQMSYKVYNHVLDLNVSDATGEALLITVDYHHSSTPTCINIPRQITRDELVKLLSDRWITNYEKAAPAFPANLIYDPTNGEVT